MMNWIYTAVMNDGAGTAAPGAPALDPRFRRLRLTPAMSAIRDLWFLGTESLYQRDAVASQIVALAYTPILVQYADAIDPRLTYDPMAIRGRQTTTLLSGDSSAIRFNATSPQGYGTSTTIELVTSAESVAARYDGGVVNSRPLAWRANWSLPVSVLDSQLSVRVSRAAAESGARFGFRHDGEVRLDAMALWRAVSGADGWVQELLRPMSSADFVTTQLREIWNSNTDVATELGVLVCAYAVKAAAIGRGS